MVQLILAKEEQAQKIRQAEKAAMVRRVRRPGRLSLVFKSLMTFVARF